MITPSLYPDSTWLPDIDWIADVFVHGKPVTKKREHYPEPKEKAYKEAVAWTFKRSNPKHKMPPKGTMLACWIMWERGRNKDGSEPKGKMDVDNVRKSVQDALNGVAYVDDGQIKSELGREILVPYGDDAVYVTIGIVRG